MANDTTLTTDPIVVARFWSKADRSAGDVGCWPWAAATTPAGYGVFHPRKGETVGANRHALSLKLGRPIQPGHFACHTCDNPSCVNPSHLYEGTPNDNVQDAVTRDRHKRGTRDRRAKLTDADIVSIRTQASIGTKNRNLAEAFGVAESLISGITRGTRWKHVGGPITHKYKTKAA